MNASRLARFTAAFAVAALTAAFAVWLVGWRVADPTNLSWMHDDIVSMQFGWEAYRLDPSPAWALSTSRASWPLAMHVAMFDLVPILALPLKAFKFLLPAHFQYLGPFFLLNAALQGFFAVLLFDEALTERPPTPGLRAGAILAALLVATAPVLYVRFWLAHPPLTAQWLIVAALWLYARSNRVSPRATVLAFAPLLFLAGGINPYLLVMAAAVFFAVLTKLAAERRMAWRDIPLAVLPLAGAVLALVLVGFLPIGGPGVYPSVGYGFYSANLNALINPMRGLLGSTLLPALPVSTTGQYEGYGYMGAGALFLCAVGLIYAMIGGRVAASFRTPLLILALVAFLVALSTRVSGGLGSGFRIAVPAPVDHVLAIFRSSGRFVWLPVYALQALAGYALLRAAPARLALAVIVGACALQIIDLAAPYADLRARFAAIEPRRFEDPMFGHLAPAHKFLIVMPPEECRSNDDYPFETFVPLDWLIMDNGLRTNSFDSGRLPRDLGRYHCLDFPKKFAPRPPDGKTAYLFTPRAFKIYGAAVARTHYCDFADGFLLCRADRGAAGLSERARAALATPF